MTWRWFCGNVKRLIRYATFSAALTAAFPGVGAQESSAVDLEFFEKTIRPILAERCYECHSAQAKKIKGNLLLDTREGLLKGGENGEVVVPGDPDKSKLILAVRYDDKDLQMPPKEKLSDEQIDALEKWVKGGAVHPEVLAAQSTKHAESRHWAFEAVRKPSLPRVKNKKWVNNDIDAFILDRLEEKQLTPARPADRLTLFRRLAFDLTGLPPERAAVEAFVRDTSSEAWSKAVQTMLDSPAFGERWARHWLDVVRYADSNGLEANVPFPNAWRYRDYVVNAFNADKPIDHFIREQLAGDLLTSAVDDGSFDRFIATGFLLLGPKAFAEPDGEKVLMDIVDEQIDVTSKAFLGLTVSCARCHDHKFDPIPTRDYYALAGIFKSTATLNETSGPGRNPGQMLSEKVLAPPAEAAVFEAYNRKLTSLQAELDSTRRMKAMFPGGMDSKALAGIVVDNANAELAGSWKSSNYSTNFVDKNYVHDGDEGKGKKSARFVPVIPEAGRYELRVAYEAKENRATNVPVSIYLPGGVQRVQLNQRVRPTLDKIFASLGFFDFPAGTNSSIEISNLGTRGFVVVDAIQLIRDSPQMAMMAKPKPAMEKEILTPDQEELQAKIFELRAQAPPALPAALAVRDGAVRNAAINIRGDHQRLGPEVPRGFLTVLYRADSPPPILPPAASGRTELAAWIASPQNPLTARVFVNRIWQHLFGRGLVETPDNFGKMGELPSHPELLDYLAIRFVEEGWSLKKLVRTIVSSSAYQMSSAYDPRAAERDPDNRLVWRMNRRRLDAEAIRDSILKTSGELDSTRGGSPIAAASATPPPIIGEEAVAVPSLRRSLYLPVIRNQPQDIFQAFDFPDAHLAAGKRFSTIAPPQALFFMNSPFVLDQTSVWVEKLLATHQADDEVLRAAIWEALGRPATPYELDRGAQFLKGFRNALQKSQPDPARQKTLSFEAYCQSLLACTEFRFIN